MNSSKTKGPTLTAEQVGERCNVDRKTIIRWALSGELPYFDLGSMYRFDPDDVEAFVASRYRPGNKK